MEVWARVDLRLSLKFIIAVNTSDVTRCLVLFACTEIWIDGWNRSLYQGIFYRWVSVSLPCSDRCYVGKSRYVQSSQQRSLEYDARVLWDGETYFTGLRGRWGMFNDAPLCTFEWFPVVGLANPPRWFRNVEVKSAEGRQRRRWKDGRFRELKS